jgi:hypothetical protein
MAASENKRNNSISFDPVASFASGAKGLQCGDQAP